MKKLCLFDLDGTIIEPHTAITKGVQYALASFGIEVEDRNQLNHFIGPPIRDSFRESYNFTEKNDLDALADKYFEYFTMQGIYENFLYPGAEEMLQSLRDAGFMLVIATSKLTDNSVKIAEYLKFEHYFDLIVGCNADGSRSIKKDIIEFILNEVKGEYLPVMIGDRKYDLIGAREAKIKGIGVTWGYGSREELEAEKPDLIVDTMDELVRVLVAN